MSELKKIVVIGPVYPYKGGISHYTGMFVNSLKKAGKRKLLYRTIKRRRK